MSLSRRNLLLGRLSSANPAPPAVDPVAALLQAARNPPPWQRPTVPAPAREVVARVLTFDCLVTLGTECSVCSEQCPEEGAVVRWNGRVAIDLDRCTGCARCVAACPAPRPAIVCVPRGGSR